MLPGVGKSGCPMQNGTMSRPERASALTSASTTNAFSVPSASPRRERRGTVWAALTGGPIASKPGSGEIRVHQRDRAARDQLLRQDAEYQQKQPVDREDELRIEAHGDRLRVGGIVEVHQLHHAQIIERADQRRDDQ